ncbi:MAG: cell division protein FtsZ [Bacteroidales bacterium]|jgi:cell division protein FtsZ|nr:cell division protein FtsZ [Bacteroidales bacterium]
MNEKMVSFSLPEKKECEIKVVGVGGGGGNAVNHMFKQGIKDVDFIICNTDAQALNASPVHKKVQLGASLTEGRGAGNKPETGKQAAIENIEDVKQALGTNTKMVFITAGMGGGTGTGGAPVIAKTCKEAGYLTVGIVTIPFRNEGRRRIKQAFEGIEELEIYVDALLVVNNERIREIFGDFGISEAFSRADNILTTAAKGIAEIITVPGYINVDFADVETVIRKSGLAVMGTGIASGEKRAEEAVEKALNSPLLNNSDIRGAKNILLNITSGVKEVTMDEIGRITDFVQNKAGFEADLIWGNGQDESLGDNISITLIATGFGQSKSTKFNNQNNIGKEENESAKVYVESEQQITRIISDKKPVVNTSQKIIEFNIAEEKEQEDAEFELLYPRTSRERNVLEKKEVIIDYSTTSDEDVDEFENTPAYKRRQLRMNDPAYDKNKTSRCVVTRENNITDSNQYIHKRVD